MSRAGRYVVVLSPLALAACAAIYGATDVPDLVDGGNFGGSSGASSSGGGSSGGPASSGSSSGAGTSSSGSSSGGASSSGSSGSGTSSSGATSASSGAGTSSSGGGGGDASVDAEVADSTVSGSSSGGGSSSGATGDDGGDATVSGSSSGTTSSSGSGSGSGSSSGSSGDDGGACTPYIPPQCGSTTCDLRSNDCCGTIVLGTTVSCTSSGAIPIAGTSECFNCPTNDAAIGNTGLCSGPSTCIARDPDGASSCPGADNVVVACVSACDCPSGQVCCAARSFGSAETACTTLAAGESCPGADAGAGAQFCAVTSECTNGQPCTTQTCTGDASITACGVQSQSPYDCSP